MPVSPRRLRAPTSSAPFRFCECTARHQDNHRDRLYLHAGVLFPNDRNLTDNNLFEFPSIAFNVEDLQELFVILRQCLLWW
jgi:hypothetical protein